MKAAVMTVLGLFAAAVIAESVAAADCKELLNLVNLNEQAAAAAASKGDDETAKFHRQRYLELIYQYQACVDQAEAPARAAAAARKKIDDEARAKKAEEAKGEHGGAQGEGDWEAYEDAMWVMRKLLKAKIPGPGLDVGDSHSMPSTSTSQGAGAGSTQH